jgi:hypothetical protein
LNETDFITAFGRLLCDPELRRAFRSNPAATAQYLCVRQSDREAIERVAPDELEVQAAILLDKRRETIQRCLPVTCARLGEKLRQTLADFSRIAPFSGGDSLNDTLGFAEYVACSASDATCQSELNRVRFAAGPERFCLRFTRDLNVRGTRRCALQIFLRGTSGTWQEWALRWC